ncbi:MAG: major facilitator transporter, partial [Hyphomonadaceae bacterium]
MQARKVPHEIKNPMSKTIDSKAFWLLFACLTLIGMGNTMLFAVLPPIARTIGMPDWTVSAIFSLSALLWVITSPIWGRISDKTGRKPIIVTGLSAYAASTIMFTLVAFFGLYFDWEWLWVVLALALARCIFGAVGSATSPAVQAYVADATSPENRTKEIAALTSAFS